MTILGRLIPSWIPLPLTGALAVVAGGAIWLLLDAREELGAAKLRAAVNGAALSVIQQQEGCPPVPEYSREFLVRAAGEVERLPAGSAVEQMLADYQVMRDQARACR